MSPTVICFCTFIGNTPFEFVQVMLARDNKKTKEAAVGIELILFMIDITLTPISFSNLKWKCSIENR